MGKSKAMQALEAVTGGPLTFGEMLWSIRTGEEMTLEAFGKLLGGVSRSQINDIEKGRRAVSIERAAQWAKILGYHPKQFIELAVQQQLDAAGLEGLRIEVTGNLRKAG